MTNPIPAFTTPSPLLHSPSHLVISSISSSSTNTTNPTITLPQMSLSTPSRRAFLLSALSLPLIPVSVLAKSKSSMSGDYRTDAARVLDDMRVATSLARGAEGMADTVGRTRQEMNDFVALYRRNDKVSGSPSFSTLYTAINTLSGHYASYGPTYPVPEKRKKRLNQQYAEIDRALNKGR